MIFISHRGNVSGRVPNRENSLPYIKDAINLGFDVEIDVWHIDGKYWLGHDNPQYETEQSFLENEKLWCHAKNIEGLHKMLQNKKTHCFWHQEDDFTLTSKQKIWTYPNKRVLERSVIVCQTLESTKKMLKENVFGVCSDYIGCIL